MMKIYLLSTRHLILLQSYVEERKQSNNNNNQHCFFSSITIETATTRSCVGRSFKGFICFVEQVFFLYYAFFLPGSYFSTFFLTIIILVKLQSTGFQLNKLLWIYWLYRMSVEEVNIFFHMNFSVFNPQFFDFNYEDA